MTFTITEPANHQSENTWFTPKSIIEKLGSFDLDPCTSIHRPFDIGKDSICYDAGQNGLTIPWQGRVFVNPPYGKEIGPFIEKFSIHRDGLMLIFARMGSVYIQELLKSGAFIYCLRKRIHFLEKNGIKKTNAGTDSCFVFYNYEEYQYCKSFEGILIRDFHFK